MMCVWYRYGTCVMYYGMCVDDVHDMYMICMRVCGVCVCIWYGFCVCVCGRTQLLHICAMAHVWHSENSLVERVLPLYP